MGKKPLCVALLWHMHQPDYGNIQTGEIYLPWTRFHAVKDYYDMGALVEQAPGMRLTINVVPSLIDQLTAYSTGTARETYASLTVKNAAELDRFEQEFLLRSFFQLPWTEMVYPYPRYRELLDRRGPANDARDYAEAARRFGTQDFRDLQVWFNLAWCGRELRQNPEIATLLQKGRNFTEEEKKRVLELQFAFIGRILPFYRRLMEERGIEISVSPYYHPILPLLCDNRSAREALPGIALPENPFSYPADAREHVTSAVRRYVEIFGRAPRGMWPSEGSVSSPALQLARESGLRWLATDEAVLINSLQKMGLASAGLTSEKKYRAYRVGSDLEAPCLFFRDHGLSDLIGFTYSHWRARDATDDFLARLRQIHSHLPDDGRHYVVPVILDGENAWEHYPENGSEFLSLLYRRLTETEGIQTVTFTEYLELEPATEVLHSVVAGSWIYGNLATWIGHPEKNRAWDALSTARSFLGQRMQSGEPRSGEAFRELMIAEGSDWFWWFGDDHQTENAAEFDSLFRTHVKNVYRLMAQPYPPDLDTPIKRTEARTQYRDPVHTITPHIDGRVTDYFEWLAAGFAIPAGGASMHRTDRYFEKLYFGYDARHFYVRLDLATDRGGHAVASPHSYHLHFMAPRECVLEMEWREAGSWNIRTLRAAGPDPAPAFAGDRILEVAITLEALGVEKPDHVRFFVSAFDKGVELERFPRSDYITVAVDPWGLDHREWIV